MLFRSGLFEGREGWARGTMPEFHLMENMRNSRRIHELLKQLGPHDDSRSVAPDGHEVERIEAADAETAAIRIEDRIRRLTTAEGVGLSQIGVLTTRREEIAALAPGGRLRGFAVTQDPFGEAGKLYLDRISRFKGLERDVVILTRLGNPPRHNRPQALPYVAASRARMHLIVVDSAEVLERFRLTPGRCDPRSGARRGSASTDRLLPGTGAP